MTGQSRSRGSTPFLRRSSEGATRGWSQCLVKWDGRHEHIPCCCLQYRAVFHKMGSLLGQSTNIEKTRCRQPRGELNHRGNLRASVGTIPSRVPGHAAAQLGPACAPLPAPERPSIRPFSRASFVLIIPLDNHHLEHHVVRTLRKARSPPRRSCALPACRTACTRSPHAHREHRRDRM